MDGKTPSRKVTPNEAPMLVCDGAIRVRMHRRALRRNHALSPQNRTLQPLAICGSTPRGSVPNERHARPHRPHFRAVLRQPAGWVDKGV